MSRKYGAFKAAQSKREAAEHERTMQPQPPQAINETAIGNALDASNAERWPDDAATLSAIASRAGMDQAMLIWWIRQPASSSRNWGTAALRAYTVRYRDLLQHITTGNNIKPSAK